MSASDPSESALPSAASSAEAAIASPHPLPLFIGCAVWAYRDWLGSLFPRGSRSSDFLRLYGERLTAVEGNTTFYSLPDAATVARWREDTPPGFRFCLKLHRDITHQGRLLPQWPQAQAFLDRMAPLQGRLGPMFAQLPPSYSPAKLADLAAFLQRWPETVPLAVEVRHANWFHQPHAEQLNDLLRRFGVGRVLLDTRPIYENTLPGEADPQARSERRKPQVPLQPVVTAGFTVVRYISHPQRDRNLSYLKTDWVPRLAQWLQQGTQVYFFAHCPDERQSPGIVQLTYHQLQTHLTLPPLPWDEQPQDPAQLSLF
jgi:uncharacterized protein YecE (DUF72 family)